MLQTSYTLSTSPRRPLSPGSTSVICSTVRPRHPHLYVRLPGLFFFVRSVLGILITVFVRCMTGLFNPVCRRGSRVKWGLAFYTVFVFSLVTTHTAMGATIFYVMYIDNRQFSGVKDLIPPGPFGYLLSISPMAMVITNNWLASGLLVSSLFNHVFTHPGV